jgi:MinD-like ATPase involved in chromosome partitioning or flagellar assembly
LPLLLAAGGAAWESALVTAFERADHGVSVARRCVDLVELLSVAAAGHGRVAIVAATLRRLDADAVDRLLASGVVPIGIVERGDAAAENTLRAMGFDRVVHDDADARVIAAVVLDAVTSAGLGRSTGRMFADPASAMPLAAGNANDVDTQPASTRDGSIVAVWGPTGAPGRTTVAAGLADEIARLGVSTLLVDADVYGGTIAMLCGLLDESPGIAAACRIAGTTRLDAASIATLAWQVQPSLRVLTGIPLAQRWPEIRTSGITAVLTAARELADWTVVDCGFGLETDEELSFDSIAPRRNGATLTVLDAADIVLAVGGCDPIGLQRLVHGLTELREAEIDTPVRIVLNRVRRTAVGGDPAAEAAAALRRFAGVDADASLPYDREGLDVAIAAGRLLGEIRPASPLRQEFVRLARDLTGIESRSTRRRRR